MGDCRPSGALLFNYELQYPAVAVIGIGAGGPGIISSHWPEEERGETLPLRDAPLCLLPTAVVARGGRSEKSSPVGPYSFPGLRSMSLGSRDTGLCPQPSWTGLTVVYCPPQHTHPATLLCSRS